MARLLTSVMALAVALSLFGIDRAQAQTLEEDQASAETGGSDALGEPVDDEAPPGRMDDEQAVAEEDAPDPNATRESTDPYEAPDTDYFFLGAMYRQVIIPGFIQGLFVEGGIDGFNPGAGLQFNWRRNNFNIIAEAWWNNAEGNGYFRAPGDPVTDTENIDAKLWVLFVNASFMWSFPLTDWFAFELGFDIGLGFIGGTLTRNEATPSTPGGEDYRPCTGPGDGVSGYCEAPTTGVCYDTNGGHYNCEEPNWFTEGGDTPFIIPWVTLPHIALRFKPIHQLQIRIDGGYGLYNFFFGGNVSYGF